MRDFMSGRKAASEIGTAALSPSALPIPPQPGIGERLTVQVFDVPYYLLKKVFTRDRVVTRLAFITTATAATRSAAAAIQRLQ